MSFRLSERIRSFRHAFRGIFLTVSTQHNAWIHLAATASVVLLGFYESLASLEWCVIVLAIALVWVTEALNTAIDSSPMKSRGKEGKALAGRKMSRRGGVAGGACFSRAGGVGFRASFFEVRERALEKYSSSDLGR